jgi:hypothetical protein|tara:strand:+ start:333 stop:626 length:294 start_codon:yes stop_codon:yes gene_type:complete
MTFPLSLILILLQANAPGNAPVIDPAPEDESTPSEQVEECREGVKGLVEGVKGLEFYLRDKKQKSIHCPSIEWEQPALDEYKKNPKSYLPNSCKIED